MHDVFGFTAQQVQQRRAVLAGPENPGYQGPPAVDVRWTDGHRGFQIGEARAKGLWKPMSQLFFPNWSWTSVQTEAARESKRLRATSTYPLPSYRKKDLKLNGLQLGGHVDTQVSDIVTEMRSGLPAITVQQMIQSMQELPDTLTVRRARALWHQRTDWHVYTKRVFSALAQARLEPIVPQLLVGSTEAYIATAVDLVCVDQAHVNSINARTPRILVELKCGFDTYHTVGTDYMNEPFEDLDDCPQNQHFLQLAFTRKLYQETFPAHEDLVNEAYVCRVHRGGVDLYKLPQNIINLVERAGFDALCEHFNSEAQKQRREARAEKMRRQQARQEEVSDMSSEDNDLGAELLLQDEEEEEEEAEEMFPRRQARVVYGAAAGSSNDLWLSGAVVEEEEEV
jgi:hypothetical protein